MTDPENGRVGSLLFCKCNNTQLVAYTLYTVYAGETYRFIYFYKHSSAAAPHEAWTQRLITSLYAV